MNPGGTIDAVCEQIRADQRKADEATWLRAENIRLRHALLRIAGTAGAKRAEPDRPTSTRNRRRRDAKQKHV